MTTEKPGSESTPAKLAALHAIFRGRVQQVGFRQFVCREAAALQVTGWVRNRLDGSVEAQMVGNGKAINELLRRCRVGPALAEVKDVNVQPGPVPDTVPTGFVARSTI